MVMLPLYGTLHLPNAWSQTLQTSKRHTFRVSAFHWYDWFGGKTVSCRLCALCRIVEGYPKNAKMLFFVSGYKIPEFFTIAPVLTSILTVCCWNRGDPSDLGCVTSIQKHSRSGLAWSRPHADRGLSRPTSVFHTSACKILSRSVEIWQYDGQKPVLE